ncbi:MAG: exosortase/archaeosortase family protein, partial [Armatimonadetes bacterium]|nr:exosortase/archaeosortase family protein [Armatimonadota bacterium]
MPFLDGLKICITHNVLIIAMNWEKKDKKFNLTRVTGPFVEVILTFTRIIQMGKAIKPIILWDVLSVLTTVILLIALYAPVIPWWIKRCSDPDGLYSHAFLIPIVSVWLLWKDRAKLSRIPYQSCPQALWGMMIGLLLQLLGVFIEARFIIFLSLIVVFVSLMWTWLGTAFMRAAWSPLAFLLFAVPLDPILTKFSVPLQVFSARLAGVIIGLAGTPVSVSGAQLSAPEFGVLIIPKCNGLQYTISLLTLATLVAMRVSGVLQKAVLVLSALPVAMFANAIRIAVVVFIGQHWGEKAATGFYHNLSGILVYGIAFAMLIGLAMLMGQSQNEVAHSANSKACGTDGVAQNDEGIKRQILANRGVCPLPASLRRLNRWVIALLGLTLLLGMEIRKIYNVHYTIDLRKLIPTAVKGWHMTGEDVSYNGEEKNWVLWRVYENSDRQRLVLHAVATPGWRGIRDYEACLVSSGWNPISRGKVLLFLRNGIPSKAQALWMSRSNGERLLSFYVYLS